MRAKLISIFLTILFAIRLVSPAEAKQRWITAGVYDDALLFFDRNSITKDGLDLMIYYREGIILDGKRADYQLQKVRYVCSLEDGKQRIEFAAPTYFDNQMVQIIPQQAVKGQAYSHINKYGYLAQVYAQGCMIAFEGVAEADERINANGKREVYSSFSHGWELLDGENNYYYDDIATNVAFSKFYFDRQKSREKDRGSLADAMLVDKQ